MASYIVKVPKFVWGGRALVAGDSFEERNTQEILTHVALGNIAPDVGAATTQREPEPPKEFYTLALSPEHETARLDDNGAPIPDRPKRRYMRRDMKADE